MNKELKQVLKNNKQKVNNWYLIQEVKRKTAQYCREHNLKCYGTGQATFTYWPDKTETRPLNYIIWQLVEDFDELLNLTNIDVHHYPDVQSMDILAKYLSLLVRIEVYYSTLQTCELEYYKEEVTKTKLVCK